MGAFRISVFCSIVTNQFCGFPAGRFAGMSRGCFTHPVLAVAVSQTVDWTVTGRLLLMALYNVSINLKGLRYISESPGFIPLLWWLLSDPDAEVRLHVLRLVQSVVLEPEVVARSGPELRSSLPLQRIRALSESRNPRLQAAARELLEDLHALGHDA
ncbi:Heat shock factor 2-binding protein [Pteropus alecto]|uniref:Heat shock factor 2-binding protein n=1 Tax=Pteropus alecto TaxID=9402 RepID=L5KDC1_PTEAL|nr:Heat shock factor 2-binding protein [Pteropus alecto]